MSSSSSLLSTVTPPCVPPHPQPTATAVSTITPTGNRIVNDRNVSQQQDIIPNNKTQTSSSSSTVRRPRYDRAQADAALHSAAGVVVPCDGDAGETEGASTTSGPSTAVATPSPLQKFKVVVSYDGTDYAGWQVQQGVDTIQERLERRLSTVLCGSTVGVQIAGSGRTDKGVHADAQVFHFNAPLVVRLPEKKNGNDKKTKRDREEDGDGEGGTTQPSNCMGSNNISSKTAKKSAGGSGAGGSIVTMKEVPIDASAILRYLRTGLPPSIQVLAAEVVPSTFHARGSCIKKRYEYTVFEGVASPFHARYCHSIGYGKRLCISEMRRAAALLIGRHDFSAFGVIDVDNNDTRDPVKNLERLDIFRDGDVNGDDDTKTGFVRIVGCCDRFLWHMMRMLAGTLIEVGLGNITPEDVGRLLEGRGRGAGHAKALVRVRTAPAQGLCLKEVYYN